MPDSKMQVSVSLVEGRPATTSLKIAEHFGRRHCDVMRDIANLIEQCPEDFHKRNFALMSRGSVKNLSHFCWGSSWFMHASGSQRRRGS